MFGRVKNQAKTGVLATPLRTAAVRAGCCAASGALLIVAAVTGCGTAQVPGPAEHPSTGPAGHLPASRSSPGTPASPATSAAAASATPQAAAGGPVPAGFAATSVTFVAPGDAFVLGTAPCAATPCTSIVHTRDRGAHWRGLPAPRAPIGRPGRTGTVWGMRFADPRHGFVFGSGLWETTDGGVHWRRDAQPGNSILSLAVIDGQVLALTARCSASAGCGQQATLQRRPLGGGAWRRVAGVRYAGILDPDDLIATQARVAALVDGSRVLVTGNGGVTVSSHPTPCTGLPAPAGAATSVAVTSATGLALLCTGQGFTGNTLKRVYVSGDGGAHWVRAGVPGSPGDGGTISAATPARLTIATASAASWLYYSGDSATHWGTSVTRLDGGSGWADLGFTTTSDGVVVYGPAFSDGNAGHSPGQLLLTSDGGATWHRVRF